MFVTQNRSAAASDRERRRSKLCYRSIYARLLCVLLTISVTVSTLIVPASAADTELYYQDILLASEYSKFENGEKVSASFTTDSWFKDVSSCGFGWDARSYEHTYQNFILTLYVNGNVAPDRLEFSHYSGRTVEAEFVSREGQYYQYRVDYQSNIAWVKVEAFFDEPFTGTLGIFSCIAIRDIGFNIDKVSWQQFANLVLAGTATLEKQQVKAERNVSLPIGHTSKRTDKYQTWFHDEVVVTGDFGGCAALDELTFVCYGQLISVVTFSILDAKTDVPLHVLEVENVAAKYSTTMGSWGENDWDVFFQQLRVDLSGYDLTDCRWELDFSLDPSSYNSTMSFTSWNISSVIARLPVENVPWYKVFWQWLSVKWDNVRDSIKLSIDSVRVNVVSSIKFFQDEVSGFLTDILKKLDDLIISDELEDKVNQSADDMDEKSNNIGKVNQNFTDVEKPDIDSEEILGPIVGYKVESGLRLLTVLTSSPIVSGLICIVFAFAFVGYMFFGKR